MKPKHKNEDHHVFVMLRYIRTACRFRASQKHKEAKKVYYKKHLSKSQRRLQVTGGKNLRESGVYTPQFCLVVIDMWEKAKEQRHLAFSSDHFSYSNLWNAIFSTSNISNETWGRSISTCFRFCFEIPCLQFLVWRRVMHKTRFFPHKKSKT